jgi:hypothetical protein
MSRWVHAAPRTFHPVLLPALRQWSSNFLSDAGLTQTSAATQVNQDQAMSASAHHHRTFLSLPRDFIRRRRLRRRIANAILIPLLGGVAAYFITRQNGGTGFSAPKTAQQASLSRGPNAASFVYDNTSTHTDRSARSSMASAPRSSMISGAYKLADGPHTSAFFIRMSQVLTPSLCFPTAPAVRSLAARL